MQELQSTLCAGHPVHVRGERWRIAATEAFDECTVVTLHGVDTTNAGETARLIVPFDRLRPLQTRTRLAGASRDDALRAAAQAVIAAPSWCSCWTSVNARIDLREWQLQPARAVLEGATRILLADEVGLGKTIQAALIVAELAARNLAQRTLVLTPASLRDQWAEELSARFGIAAAVLDQASLATLIRRLPVGVNPWRANRVVVSSIDLVKRPEVRAAVDETTFDVLIVDEAHHLTPGSDRAALVADLARRVPWLILVTATPHSGDDDAYRTLAGMGDVAGRDELRVFRRAARDLEVAIPRRVRLVSVVPTSSERAVLDATMAYARALWRVSALTAGAGLVGSIIARRAASCAQSALRTLRRRRAILAGAPAEMSQASLPWEDGSDSADAVDADQVLGVAGFDNRQSELAQLDGLIRLAERASSQSSKVDVILRVLRRTREPALVFSEYRDTVEWVAARLADAASVSVLHGGMSIGERRASVSAFTSGRSRVLVATDAAGEGLNLQSRGRLVINLELPWNPQRLEQRIGRLARIGQAREVHALHLVHRASFEDDVLARVERRRLRALAALGPAGTSTALRPEWESAARRLRRLLPRPRRGLRATDTQVAATTRSGHPPRALVLIAQSDLLDASGALVQRVLIPALCELEPGPASSAQARALAMRLGADRDIRDWLNARVQARARSFSSGPETFAAFASARIRGLIAALERLQPPTPLQGSLFDRRREQEACARDAVRHLWREHLMRLLQRTEAVSRLSAETPHIVAIWATE